ncbi:hypothetical protein [Ponticaulis sp.]|uniref:hypothetical protein n=1 Tax=Ponticaulis sp. TaxID=2020902 RepID=UPI0025CBE1C8|nr:hypothetical protein [Ponticaulis sp.]|tara:strand:- start:605 stop:862 length:258 start_codon:yes stop_codon:yes gene_type:complete
MFALTSWQKCHSIRGMDYLSDLLDRAEAFARESGQSVKTVSGKLFGNGSRIADYRAGKVSPTLGTLKVAEARLKALKSGSETEAA